MSWQRVFTEHRVCCVQADLWTPEEYWLNDEQAKAMQLTTPASHPAWGAYRRHGPMVTFDELSPPSKAAPLAGQHNAELLQECGFTQTEIDDFTERGVIWAEER